MTAIDDTTLSLMGLTPDEGAIAEAMPKAHIVFGEFARLLGEQDFFAGDLSLADLMLAPQIDFFSGLPEWELLMGPYANLRSWHERMNARPACKRRHGKKSRKWPKRLELLRVAKVKAGRAAQKPHAAGASAWIAA